MLVKARSSLVFWRNLGLFCVLMLLSNLFTPVTLPVASAQDTPPLRASNSPLSGPIRVRSGEFIDGTGQRFFVSGVNYEGHTDRAWALWNDDKFDLNLINQDLSLAAAGGYNAIRIFVQPALRDDILGGKWYKLDKMVEIAAQNNLLLLITMADYDELDLTKLAYMDGLIAKHLAGSPYVLGYDLKNEPQFVDLAGGKYPDDKTPSIQTDYLIQTYGEKMNQSQVDSWRNTAEGQRTVPPYLSQKAGYYFANAYKLYLQFLDEGSKWVVSHTNSNFVDWLKSSDSAFWKPFVDSLSESLQIWLSIRQGAIRAADPNALTTIGFNHPYFAFLKANQSLSFISLHRFVPEGASNIYTTLTMLDQLKQQHIGKPLVLEEFGYSNSHGQGKDVPLSMTANYEAAVWLFLYSRGYAGGFKWMLTNYPVGSNLEENNFGLLDDQARPKPAFYVARAIHSYIAANRRPTGDFVLLESRDGKDVTYMWTAGDVIFSNLKDYTDTRIDLHQQDMIGWQAWWPGNVPGKVYFNTASSGRVIFDLGKFFPTWNPSSSPADLIVDGGRSPGLDRKDTYVSFGMQPGWNYILNVSPQVNAFLRANPSNKPNSLYFKETGHNLSGAFRTYWEKNGGLWLYGFPISEEFQEGNYVVQYFERNRFEYHPEAAGTPYEVLLGLLGTNVTAGRKEAGEAPFQPIQPNAVTNGRIFFQETGHSLGGSFYTYWQKYGGLLQFGYPLTEEFQELNPADGKTYVVQYFERARFEYHPENKGTPNEVLLGLLGVQVAKARGWIG
jgi:hypothetical protein